MPFLVILSTRSRHDPADAELGPLFLTGSTHVAPAPGADERRVGKARADPRPDGERFRLALAGSSVTAFTMDRELRYTWMENPALGQVPDTVVGHTDADLLPARAGARMTAVKRRVVEHGESIAEEVAVHGAGADHWYWLTAHAIRDSQGRITGLAGQSTDITERKRVEQARGRALADLEVAQRSARLGSWSWDANVDEVSWSAQLYEIFGRDPTLGPAGIDEIVAYVHPEDRERVADAYAAGVIGPVPAEFDYRILAGDGSERVLHSMGHEDPAAPGCHRGTIQDVTEQRMADRERIRMLEELHASEELFMKGFVDSPIGMALTNLDGTLRRINATFARMLGYDDPDELAGLPWGPMTHPDDVEFKRAAVKSLRRDRRPAGRRGSLPGPGRQRRLHDHRQHAGQRDPQAPRDPDHPGRRRDGQSPGRAGRGRTRGRLPPDSRDDARGRLDAGRRRRDHLREPGDGADARLFAGAADRAAPDGLPGAGPAG